MSKENNLHEFLVDIAEAVREKKGTTEPINAQRLSEEIMDLPSGGEVNTFGEVMVDKTGGGNSSVTSVVISNDVEIINTYAYRYFSNLKQVNFGDSMRDIGDYAFNYCTKLESVVLPKSISSIRPHAFSQCVNLRHFEIPIDAPITRWTMDLLWNSPLLRSIVIPKNITIFDQFAIEQCTGVECIDLSNCLAIPLMLNVNAFSQTTGQFIIPDNLYDEWIVATNWSTYADRIVKASEYVYLDFADPVVEKLCAENIGDGIGTTQAQANAVTTFPAIFQNNAEITSFDEFERFENVTTIKAYAFNLCKNLTKIKMPQNIERIESSVFADSPIVGDINLPNLKALGARVFYDTAIESVSNLGSITVIYNFTFTNCKHLTRLVIPDSVVELKDYIFQNNSSLESVVIPTGITAIGKACFLQCTSLSIDVNLPNLTLMGDYAWQSSNIRRVVSLGNITGIRDSTFKDCRNLVEVNIPDTCVELGNSTFRNCESLKVFNMKNINKTNNNTWFGCKSLESIIVPSVQPPTIGSAELTETNSTFKIYVHDDSVDTYKSATNWAQYADRIKPLSEYQPNNE